MTTPNPLAPAGRVVQLYGVTVSLDGQAPISVAMGPQGTVGDVIELLEHLRTHRGLSLPREYWLSPAELPGHALVEKRLVLNTVYRPVDGHIRLKLHPGKVPVPPRPATNQSARRDSCAVQ